eukprot:CAMPEP_0174382502 /NCGR_PEP_ID=MMETSP0811_2-20130205/124639_1 /TAXON_ID=73025 ORGANISM="Eutreptiella gymnastica-like, Strain CCMP1594" /NCGR_SAMPLE_ID=MMETSP0811_2 /ASSEMBLY_ACC=CAM_ASM_000667 /LENGTH=68 /DNA_ID=CAMNT_0015535831 /DNA_START=1292 /DNA_END=1498 /DNA_ORIENTATION=+
MTRRHEQPWPGSSEAAVERAPVMTLRGIARGMYPAPSQQSSYTDKRGMQQTWHWTPGAQHATQPPPAV